LKGKKHALHFAQQLKRAYHNVHFCSTKLRIPLQEVKRDLLTFFLKRLEGWDTNSEVAAGALPFCTCAHESAWRSRSGEAN